jgi:ribosomal protein S17
MSIGFIKLHRKIIEWEWYSDINVCRVFLHLLVTANFENKKWQGIDISRGQVITSLEKLGKSTTLTIQQVRTALTKLKSTHEITIKATKLHTFITLTNYNLYQDKIVESNTPDNTPDNNSSTKKQQRSNKEATTTKEIKESEERKESNPLTEDFQKFWEDYTPVKVLDGKVVPKGSRKAAMIAYERARKKHSTQKIYEGAAKYLVNCYDNNRLSCQAVVFLNQERFLDDYEQTNLEVKKHD